METVTLVHLLLLLLLLLPLVCHSRLQAPSPDGTSSPSISGYLVYCPCMGRFGNQAEQFLGSLSFARRLGRTLVVPPWISYGPPVRAAATVQLVPFGRHFNLTALAAFHPVVSMEQFMDKLAPAVWPPGSRTVFCHSPRDDGTCQAKSGSPFGPFWDAFSVSFDREEFYGGAAESPPMSDGASWRRRYPSQRYPVLAFMGAPGAFPALPRDLPLHRHLVFSEQFADTLRELIAKWDLQRPILGVHLRNNVDFTGACSSLLGRLPPGHGLFSSYQCFGPASSLGHLTMATCAPDDATLSDDVRRVAEAIGARTVFVATDHDGRLDLVRAAAPGAGRVLSSLQTGTDVFQDVGLLSSADAVLLNCASSLSAFVRRTRDAAGRPTEYLGRAGAPGWRHDEL